jgi:hypothetical protein
MYLQLWLKRRLFNVDVLWRRRRSMNTNRRRTGRWVLPARSSSTRRGRSPPGGRGRGRPGGMRRRATRHRRSGSDGPIPDVGRLTPRTLLFVPGDRPDRFDKAAAAGADGAIIDLEDSVPAQHTEQARAATAAWLARASAWVRVNPCGTDDFPVDVDRARQHQVLPGSSSPRPSEPRIWTGRHHRKHTHTH